MKTLQLNEQIVRVSDAEGAKLFLEGWKYIPKSLWKEKVRDVAPEKDMSKKTSNKMSKAEKRHLRKASKK